MIKNLTAMWKTWVQSLGQEDALKKGTATHSSILAWWVTVHGVAKSRAWLSDFHFQKFHKDMNIIRARYYYHLLR